MKRIKLSINSPVDGLIRQTPLKDGIWGDYKFIINEIVEECDFWVVYSKGQKMTDTAKVPPGNLIFISGEPKSVYHYSKRFLNQFDKLITSRRDLTHRNIIYYQPAQPWWVGRNTKPDGSINFTLEFNDFLSSPPKTKLISVITSSKSFTRGHNERIKFVSKLKEHFGDRLDVFGRGINGFQDKWDTLKDYKYHIALENSSELDYWTEKLADCYLAECFPFYFGCTNLSKYFSKESYESIDIQDLYGSIRIIEDGIANNLFEKRYLEVKESKNKVLFEFNLFPAICKICNDMDTSIPKKTVTIQHEMSFFDPYKLIMLLKRFYYRNLY